MQSLTDPIPLIQSLFKGREDVFAMRWEKGKRSGYMPAYSLDPYHYRIYKMNGGTFKDYPHKSYLRLSSAELQKHLEGKQQIGIYPLLPNNTSWFLAADFDGKNWQKEALLFLNACTQNKLPAYLERSRSGNGGHVWLFFEQAYPAVKSRKIFLNILKNCGAVSLFDKTSSFDRLFPNQDFLSGKGFGNLIALPFYKPTFDQGNSCFVNPDNFEAYVDQWKFLSEVKRIPTNILDELHQKLTTKKDDVISYKNTGNLQIHLNNKIRIYRNGMTLPLINFIKEELNFANTAFFVKKNTGRSTHNTNRYFNLIEETETEVILPRGFIGKLLRFCKKQNLQFDFEDHRKLKKKVDFSFHAKLRSHQNNAIKAVAKKDFGVIVAPPGSGKTVMGLKIISNKKQPALIIVHRQFLLDQWRERIEAFLGIPKKDIGIIGKGRAKIRDKITVATIQSLPKQMEKIKDRFGLILVDECHYIPAKSYRQTIEKLSSYYLYGLTATPFRKYNDDKLIFAFLGKIIVQIKNELVEDFKNPEIIIRNTSFKVPFNSKTDDFETLSNILIHDSERNKLILKDIKKEISEGRKIVVLTERTNHLKVLFQLLKKQYEVISLSGEDSAAAKKSKWKNLHAGNFQLLLTTGQYFGEGVDLANINTLFLVYPFSFKGKLIQYIGRVQRSEISPTIYDYRDIKIDYLNKLFLKRNTYYRKIIKQASLFDEPKEIPTKPKSNHFKIDKTIKIPIEKLDFRYGNVGFEFKDKPSGQRLLFEMENEEIRPEFEVLKSYFIRVLNSKSIAVQVFAEIENGVILSQIATSTDIDKINKEIVESVKFQFLTQGIVRQKTSTKQPNSEEENDFPSQTIFPDAEAILDALLKHKSYKHSRYIRFLAKIHRRDLMKLRFVLEPFSFVFLVKGSDRYHVILETLDTNEATYIWHRENDYSSLSKNIRQIDNALNFIREKGRQAYLDSEPQNFSRILHDYSEGKKGFIMWKSSLEERLV